MGLNHFLIIAGVTFGAVSALFSQPIVAAGAFIGAGLFSVADALKSK